MRRDCWRLGANECKIKFEHFTGWTYPMSFLEDNAAFETWLAGQCQVVKPDLEYKHKRMRRDAFTFLRATYFRWAGCIEAACPELAATPAILAVGDIHLENFGTWRDAEGRLVWGVNDFDEAAVMPYAFDLVRLAASARLAGTVKKAKQHRLTPFAALPRRDIDRAILEGYRAGLDRPHPTLLDERETWLRPYVACSDKQRRKFWEKDIDTLPTTDPDPPAKVIAGFRRVMPKRASIERLARRPKQGSGSLGRPRFVAIASWNGGRIAREAKALIPSAWDWAHGRHDAPSRFADLSSGPHRSPDPWLRVENGFIFRRIAADSRKVNLLKNPDTNAAEPDASAVAKLLAAMGFELGAIHAADASRTQAIENDLDGRDPDWLHNAAEAASARVVADYEAWCAIA